MEEPINKMDSMWDSLPYSERTRKIMEYSAIGVSAVTGFATSVYVADAFAQIVKPKGVIGNVGAFGLQMAVGAGTSLMTGMIISSFVELAGNYRWNKELAKAEKETKKRYHEYPQPDMDLYPKFSKDEDGIVFDGEAPQVVEEETDGEGGNA